MKKGNKKPMLLFFDWIVLLATQEGPWNKNGDMPLKIYGLKSPMQPTIVNCTCVCCLKGFIEWCFATYQGNIFGVSGWWISVNDKLLMFFFALTYLVYLLAWFATKNFILYVVKTEYLQLYRAKEIWHKGVCDAWCLLSKPKKSIFWQSFQSCPF